LELAYNNFIYNPYYKAKSFADLMSSQAGQLVKCPTIEEFINKCKTDTEFSEKWGLKIEERELSLEERCDEYIKRNPKQTNDGVLNYNWIGYNLCNSEDYDKWDIPTKLITMTYNNQIVERYE
jgi:hypothetical protein